MDNPSFTALSYVWGNESSTDEVVIAGVPIPVTRTLARALRWVKHHWRQHFAGRDGSGFRVWADALCINQLDIDERNQQVQLMGDSYSQAELVVASVSTFDSVISLALRTYNEIHRVLTITEPPLSLSELKRCLWLKRIPSLCSESLDVDTHPRNQAWQAINKFQHLPYWKRVWIVQETALAKKLLLFCDSECIDFDKIDDISKILQRGKLASVGQPDHYINPNFMSDKVWCPAC
jgi:hypothetical protein